MLPKMSRNRRSAIRSRVKKNIARRQAHHLWSASEDAEGRIRLVRAQEEPEEFKTARVANKSRRARVEVDPELVNATWGLFGASLIDDATLSKGLPRSIAERLNIVSARSQEEPPAVKSWDDLKRAFGSEVITDIRKSISNGMQVRIASKNLNVPFVVAAEILDRLGSDADTKKLSGVLEMVRSGKTAEALKKHGSVAAEIVDIYSYYEQTGEHKIAIDEAAKDYYESYYGPFGKELTREIRKRVRADAARVWLRRNAVDEAAAEYWSNYYGEYGEEWVSILPKKISPAK